jgi:7,8-dihydropterin-6-yl-methyl-4-(beta-D-ribofuranosyl)aminobenzene 5'-phosphate synthase
MGIDLSNVDMAFISHGHHDHGGGLSAFFEINDKAQVYITPNAFQGHYHKNPDGGMVYIGMDVSMKDNSRLIHTSESMVIDDQLEVFSNIRGNLLSPSGNRDLWAENDNTYIQDDFSHEQNLVVREGGNTVLICGCAHRGIVNIIEHLAGANNIHPTHTIGGLHLFSPSSGKSEDPAVVRSIGEYLLGTSSAFYTGHCTGMQSYESLKDIMGGKIRYIPAGSIFEI